MAEWTIEVDEFQDGVEVLFECDPEGPGLSNTYSHEQWDALKLHISGDVQQELEALRQHLGTTETRLTNLIDREANWAGIKASLEQQLKIARDSAEEGRQIERRDGAQRELAYLKVISQLTDDIAELSAAAVKW